MQQTNSYLRWISVAGLASALFAASACVVTSGSDDDDAGAGGDDTAGTAGTAAGAGGATAGSGGAATAGTGGAAPAYLCDAEVTTPGTPNPSCEPEDADANDCTRCIASKCCTEYKKCFASNPGDQCGFGGPNDDTGGEILCMELCAQQKLKDEGVLGDDEVFACSAQCASSTTHKSSQDCGAIGGTTSETFGCIKNNCMVECIGEP